MVTKLGDFKETLGHFQPYLLRSTPEIFKGGCETFPALFVSTKNWSLEHSQHVCGDRIRCFSWEVWPSLVMLWVFIVRPDEIHCWFVATELVFRPWGISSHVCGHQNQMFATGNLSSPELNPFDPIWTLTVVPRKKNKQKKSTCLKPDQTSPHWFKSMLLLHVIDYWPLAYKGNATDPYLYPLHAWLQPIDTLQSKSKGEFPLLITGYLRDIFSQYVGVMFTSYIQMRAYKMQTRNVHVFKSWLHHHKAT